MAEDFIVEIYEKAQIVYEIKKMVQLGRQCKWLLFLEKWRILSDSMVSFCRDLYELDSDLSSSIWKCLEKVTNLLNSGNENQVADELELLIPRLYNAMSYWSSIDVIDGANRLYSSKSGYLTLQNVKDGHIRHSEIDPVWEAYEQAQAIYIPTMERFCTLGCGLGYLCWQMFEISNHSIDIYIYDTDEDIIQYALQFGVLYKIPEERLHVVVKNDPNELLGVWSEQLDYYLQSKAVLNLDEKVIESLTPEGQKHIQRIQTMIQTSRDFLKIEELNFHRNWSNAHATLSDLKKDFKCEEWIIIGGGPSVDDNIDYLKNIKEDKKILAVSTIYKKLKSLDIKVDFIIACDPQNRTYRHLEGCEYDNVPLIISDIVNWQFTEKYKGDKYLVPMGGYYFSREMYNSMKQECLLGSGTVSTLAVDIAAYLGAKKIELIGIDLAYPDKKSHASGTMDYKEVQYSDMIKIKSVDGGEVYTSKVFKEYIMNLEEQIRKYKSITFYNLSKNGAYIKGCKKTS